MTCGRKKRKRDELVLSRKGNFQGITTSLPVSLSPFLVRPACANHVFHFEKEKVVLCQTDKGSLTVDPSWQSSRHTDLGGPGSLALAPLCVGAGSWPLTWPPPDAPYRSELPSGEVSQSPATSFASVTLPSLWSSLSCHAPDGGSPGQWLQVAQPLDVLDPSFELQMHLFPLVWLEEETDEPLFHPTTHSAAREVVPRSEVLAP